ncbi:MAG: hypothetical protein ACJLTB_22900 [Algoriphagus aquaeductus]|uniref:hypothetical protein n=1 Tax=Algoriphagus aquaeductus TaxID=475299 RepID=UPI00387A0FE8
MVKLIFGFVFSFLLYSCNSSSDLITSQTKEVQFQLLDSILVESLSELYLVDRKAETGELLFKEKQLKEILLTDSKGKILLKPNIKGEGPSQVAQPWELAFWGNGIAIKEISPEMRVHFFNSSMEKIRRSEPLAEGINMLEVAPLRNQFKAVEIDGKTLLIGADANAVTPKLMGKDFQNSNFYSLAESGFIIDSQTGVSQKINLYPDSWLPRKEGRWVGMSTPFFTGTTKSQLVAVLPRIGDQLFLFKLRGNELIPYQEVLINHPDRKRNLKFNVEDEPLLYPGFFDLKAGGTIFLAHFYTEVPREPYLAMKNGKVNTNRNPEFAALLKNYRKSRYLLIDEKGSQSPITKLPIEGEIHFIDQEDVIYIKPDSEVEKDYNVFYRYKIFFKN